MGRKKKTKGKKGVSLDEFLKTHSKTDPAASGNVTSVNSASPKPPISDSDEISLTELRKIDMEDQEEGGGYGGGGEWGGRRNFGGEGGGYGQRRTFKRLTEIPAPYNVFMGNLAYDAEERDVRDFFGKEGIAIKEVKMPFGDKRGFCFIEFAGEEDANMVISKNLTTGFILQRRFHLQESQKRERHDGYGGEDGGDDDRQVEFGSRKAQPGGGRSFGGGGGMGRPSYGGGRPMGGGRGFGMDRPPRNNFNRPYDDKRDLEERYKEADEEKFTGFGMKRAAPTGRPTGRGFNDRGGNNFRPNFHRPQEGFGRPPHGGEREGGFGRSAFGGGRSAFGGGGGGVGRGTDRPPIDPEKVVIKKRKPSSNPFGNAKPKHAKEKPSSGEKLSQLEQYMASLKKARDVDRGRRETQNRDRPRRDDDRGKGGFFGARQGRGDDDRGNRRNDNVYRPTVAKDEKNNQEEERGEESKTQENTEEQN